MFARDQLHSARWDRVHSAPWGRRLLVDVLAVVALSGTLGVLLSSARVVAVFPVDAVHLLLTLAAAAVGAGSAILAVVASRMLGDHRPTWIAAALILYCAVVLPWSTIAPAEGLDPAERVSRLAVHLTALVLLGLSVRPPLRLGAWGAWVVTATGGTLSVAALWLPAGPAVRWLVEGPVPAAIVLLGWATAAIAFVVDGARTRDSPVLRFGIGLAVLAVAQLCRAVLERPSASGGLAFAGLRLFGLVIVMAGLAQCVHRTLRALRVEQWQQQEDLTAAALQLERADELAAERDHELRNGLAGLAGITHLLNTDTDGVDYEPLKHAVLAELGRLHMILDGPVLDPDGAEHADPATDYLVEPVLSGLVTLRRSSGGRVRLHVEPGLRAHGHSTVLAQVVTNLLANCDRHAPGAVITIGARQGNGTIVVDVRDDGPGLKRGIEGSVLDRGVRDETAGGSGLGLHITRRLLACDGGSVVLRDAEGQRGCVATVTVPATGVDLPGGARAGSTARVSGR